MPGCAGAGDITGRGDDLFLLTLDETLDVLGDDRLAFARIEPRRATYDRYRALPRYPAVIRGPFHPERWAAERAARSAEIIDRSADRHSPIAGHPGAAGVVEGRARVLADLDHAEALEADEIVVTPIINVG